MRITDRVGLHAERRVSKTNKRLGVAQIIYEVFLIEGKIEYIHSITGLHIIYENINEIIGKKKN